MIYKYVIIGAGPAGLQTAYYLQKYNIDYVILERNPDVGSFFEKYPIHRKLISINKVHTGENNKDFNLRHDWNSLLCDNDELLFKNYSNEYYPDADVLVKYLKDFYVKNNLNIKFNQSVLNISLQEYPIRMFLIKTEKEVCMAEKLIIATGTDMQNKFNLDGIINYSDLSLDKEKFVNKKILIIGGGNSAYEVANHLTDTAAVISINTRNPIRFAWQTHYVGDVRAINNNFLDTYQLKSQNQLVEGDFNSYINKIKYENNKYHINITNNNGEIIEHHYYDFIINCTGFKFDNSIFSFTVTTQNNLPVCKSNYESIDIPNLFFTGRLMHYRDYKISSGAFIHGFRYLIRSFVNIETNNLEKISLDKSSIVNKILYRINNSSGLFQMFGFLTDIIIINRDDNGNIKKLDYIEEIPIHYAEENILSIASESIVLSLNYGKEYGGKINYISNLEDSTYVFGKDRVKGSEVETAHLSNFIHPILHYYQFSKIIKTFHIMEDLDTKWSHELKHIKPLKDFLNSIFTNL